MSVFLGASGFLSLVGLCLHGVPLPLVLPAKMLRSENAVHDQIWFAALMQDKLASLPTLGVEHLLAALSFQAQDKHGLLPQ